MICKQMPLGSKFGASTTASEVIAGENLEGRTAIVTGGAGGLGREIVFHLAQAGAQVVVPARSVQQANERLRGIGGLEIAEMNLCDLRSVERFAAGFASKGKPLHLLINCAGVMATPFSRDARGIEMQFSSNHLGHFFLTQKLWPSLKAAGGARVVALSSRGHVMGGIDFDDPNFERRPYDPIVAYAQAKTANSLFAIELDRRGVADGVRAFSVHPGSVLTPLFKHVPIETLRHHHVVDDQDRPVIAPENDRKTLAQGAATPLWCAISADLAGYGGVYCEDCDIAAASPPDPDIWHGVKPWACDPELAARLWYLSMQLTGAA